MNSVTQKTVKIYSLAIDHECEKQEHKQLHTVSAILPLPQEQLTQLDPEF